MKNRLPLYLTKVVVVHKIVLCRTHAHISVFRELYLKTTAVQLELMAIMYVISDL